MALLVDDHHAVGVAVERDADVGAHLAHLAAQRVRRGRAAFLVDVEAVRLDADRDHLGAELPQRLGRHLVGGAVGAVDDHAQAFERQVARQACAWRIRCSGRARRRCAWRGRARGSWPSCLVRSASISASISMLDLVGELVAVRPEQLDAVVVERIVRGRDHDAEIGAHRARQHGDRRRRHRAEQQHVHADRGEAGDQRGLDHVAGQPRVLADHHAMAVVAAAKHQAGRLPDLQRQFRRDHAVGAAANAVGAEILANHVPPPPVTSGRRS